MYYVAGLRLNDEGESDDKNDDVRRFVRRADVCVRFYQNTCRACSHHAADTRCTYGRTSSETGYVMFGYAAPCVFEDYPRRFIAFRFARLRFCSRFCGRVTAPFLFDAKKQRELCPDGA